MSSSQPGLFYKPLKRLMDVSAASAGLIATAPLTLPAAAAIYVTMGRPILFRQQRPGLHGEPFSILKFRTMRLVRPGEDMIASDGDRITRVGNFLRKTSIDELPTLLNVLSGEMSLVGPRPLLMSYLERYSPEQRRRHDVKPGVTGWAQVNGRNTLSWEEKFEHDCWYVDNRSLMLDLKIVWMTVGKVLKKEGISAQGSATTVEFKGSATA